MDGWMDGFKPKSELLQLNSGGSQDTTHTHKKKTITAHLQHTVGV